jgi:hypothetical protein
MARPKYPSDDLAQFMVRLQPSLKERIKAHADSEGRSMNAEIVRVLEREFPEPWKLGDRVKQLLGAVAMLKDAGDPDGLVDDLSAEIEKTLEGIASGRVVDVDEDKRSQIRRGLERWHEEQEEAGHNAFVMSLDEDETESYSRTGRVEKF